MFGLIIWSVIIIAAVLAAFYSIQLIILIPAYIFCRIMAATEDMRTPARKGPPPFDPEKYLNDRLNYNKKYKR